MTFLGKVKVERIVGGRKEGKIKYLCSLRKIFYLHSGRELHCFPTGSLGLSQRVDEKSEDGDSKRVDGE